MNRIKKLREEFNMTQQDLANKLQSSKSVIGLYENETRKPSMEVLIKLSEIFKCSIDYILGKSYYRNYEDFQKTDNFVLENIRNLNGEEVKEIAHILNYINRNNVKDIDDFINTEISNFDSNNKLTLKRITSHLHYRYHGKIPENFTTENIINKIADNNDNSAKEFRFAYHKETEGLTDEEISDALRFYKEMKKRVEEDKK